MLEKLDFQKVKEDVKAIVSEVTEVPAEDLKEDAQFVEDLGVDSMMALEVVVEIEKKYKISIPEDTIPQLSSLGKIYESLEEKLINNG